MHSQRTQLACRVVASVRRAPLRPGCSSATVRASPKDYVGSDGRRKSTIEEAFVLEEEGSQDSATTHEGRMPPWGIGWQTAERNLAWNDELKGRLIKVSLWCSELTAVAYSHIAHHACDAACGR